MMHSRQKVLSILLATAGAVAVTYGLVPRAQPVGVQASVQEGKSGQGSTPIRAARDEASEQGNRSREAPAAEFIDEPELGADMVARERDALEQLEVLHARIDTSLQGTQDPEQRASYERILEEISVRQNEHRARIERTTSMFDDDKEQ